ncbi:chaplin family protein [Streptomyces sp. NPDC059256]|uniref:chaplin n=1 Tax=Streptomyces sp. NPDC059256 TaxID=3346794 RepID=UPI00368CC941
MRQVTRKGLITMAAAGSAMALGGYAHADSGAFGGASNSPGVASGNSVQVPVNVPVNACGNSVNAVGILNPTFGNTCRNDSSSQGRPAPGNTSPGGGVQTGEGQTTGGGAVASGVTSNSPGVLSGNNVQAPVDVPVNVCGNSVNVVSALNPTFGNDCTNASSVSRPGNPQQPPVTPVTPAKPRPVEPRPGNPVEPSKPRHVPPNTGTQTKPEAPQERTVKPATHSVADNDDSGTLAATGVHTLGVAVPAGAAMLLAGAVLYRRNRAA